MSELLSGCIEPEKQKRDKWSWWCQSSFILKGVHDMDVFEISWGL